MSVWVTFVGLSEIAVYNPIWAVIKEKGEILNKIYFLVTKKSEKLVGSLKEKCQKIIIQYGGEKVDFEIIKDIEESNLISQIELVEKIVKEEKNQGNKVIVDTTPGRKIMSNAALLGAQKGEADQIIYLHLKDSSYVGVDYPMIPYPLQELHNLEKFREA